MHNLIIQGDDRIKTLTLSYPVSITTAEGVQLTLPAGLEITALLEYFHSALDNNPTPLNKETMLSDQTQALLGMPPDSDTYVGTPDKAFAALASRIPSIYQQLMTGRMP